MTERRVKAPGRRNLWGIAMLVILVAAVMFVSTRSSRDQDAADGEQPTFETVLGPLTISVTEAGTIRPREQIIIKSEVEGQAAILSLVAEGTLVKAGDLLIELDASSLLDDRVNQGIQVINAEASFTGARENLGVVRNQADADVQRAELDLQFARSDLQQYEEGEYPMQMKEANAKITLARETLTNSENSLAWSRKLFEEKYIAETDLKKDELATQKAQLDLELAEEQLTLLEDFTHERQMALLKSNVKQTGMALERMRGKAAADVALAEAQLRAREAELQKQRDKLAKLERQIEKTRIVAPTEGTVIYASSTRASWRGNNEPLDEGQVVRERQELIHLPTTAAFNAEIKVHESSLEKIRVGLPVQVTVDALQGRVFNGVISFIAPLPDAQSVFMNPDLKVYNTSIQIENGGDGLRNGMSCQAVILVDRHESAMQVPVQSVIRVGGKPTVFVLDGGEVAPRQVQIGLDNNRMVHVIEGLSQGEVVLMAPPLSAGEAAPAEFDVEIPPAAVTAPRTGDTRSGGATPHSPPGDGAVKEAPAEDKGEQQRGRWTDMSPEEREKMRQRFQNMTPEEREKMRERGGGGRSGGRRGDRESSGEGQR